VAWGGGQGESQTAEAVMAQLRQIVTCLFEHTPQVAMYCHGDAWADNVMFRRDAETGKVNGVALVDLAGFRLGSPLCDFYGFVSSCTSAEVRQGKYCIVSLLIQGVFCIFPR
jgi:aminoglycoside phosphotransferase (APT) family kinase protein